MCSVYKNYSTAKLHGVEAAKATKIPINHALRNLFDIFIYDSLVVLRGLRARLIVTAGCWLQCSLQPSISPRI